VTDVDVVGSEQGPTQLTPAVIIDALRARGWTIATGESLTAGRVAATLADVPGCSDVLRGGVVAYQADVKVGLLGVPADVAARGVVSAPVAEAMARGAAVALRADVGIATTGVAGPEPHEGEPVGSVWIAVATADHVTSRHLVLDGDREAIRSATVDACWELLSGIVG
jgi:nicotinamide-nucleotide amidase